MINSPEVNLKLKGDKEAASEVIPEVFSAFNEHIKVQNDYSDNEIDRFTKTLSDGSTVEAVTVQGHTSMTITSQPKKPSIREFVQKKDTIGLNNKEHSIKDGKLVKYVAVRVVLFVSQLDQIPWGTLSWPPTGAERFAGEWDLSLLNFIVAGGIWDVDAQSMQSITARELTKLEVAELYNTASEDNQTSTQNFLIQALPASGSGNTLIIDLESVGNLKVSQSTRLFYRGGPIWQVGMPGYTSSSYMMYPISSMWNGSGENFYDYELSWGFAYASGYPILGSGDDTSWDVGTLNNYVVYDVTSIGHDWRIDSSVWMGMGGESEMAHICFGGYRQVSDSDTDYSYAEFAWLTRYGTMYAGHTLLPGMSVCNSEEEYGTHSRRAGPVFSDYGWERSIMFVPPWSVGNNVYDAVVIHGRVLHNYSGRPEMIDEVDAMWFWNIRGCCEKSSVSNPLDLENSDAFVRGISSVVQEGLRMGDAEILHPDVENPGEPCTVLPAEMFLNNFGIPGADFTSDAGLVVCDRPVEHAYISVIPIEDMSKISPTNSSTDIKGINIEYPTGYEEI